MVVPRPSHEHHGSVRPNWDAVSRFASNASCATLLVISVLWNAVSLSSYPENRRLRDGCPKLTVYDTETHRIIIGVFEKIPCCDPVQCPSDGQVVVQQREPALSVKPARAESPTSCRQHKVTSADDVYNNLWSTGEPRELQKVGVWEASEL
jgi:hypothetical protein